MNKEAIERTKERCWQELKPVLTNGLELARLEMIRRAEANKHLQVYAAEREMILKDQSRDQKKSSIPWPVSPWNPKCKKCLFVLLCAYLAALIFAIIIFSPSAHADIYVKIGSGYKLVETDHIVRTTGEKVYFNTGGKLSARIEVGKDHGNWSYGISHHSQWFSGFPVNEDGNEYQKTELFIDYKWAL